MIPVRARARACFLPFVALASGAHASAQSLSQLSPQVRRFAASEATHFLIRNVTLIDGTGAPAQRGMSVEVLDGRIVLDRRPQPQP